LHGWEVWIDPIDPISEEEVGSFYENELRLKKMHDLKNYYDILGLDPNPA
jgi:hypothetical protein